MKTEIRFRGKRVDNKEWVEGGFGILGEDTDLEKSVIIVSTLDTNSYVDKFYFTDVEVIPETVGQFTGLKDKNGVEIFEGDVVQYETDYDLMRFEVKWNKDTLMWEAASQVIVDEPLYYKNGFIEIIGSIHDNLESFKIDNSET